MKHLRLLRSGSAWAFASKIAVAVCGLAVSAALGRLLGPELIGQYFLFVQLVILGALLFSVGLQSSSLKLIGIAADSENWGMVWALVRRVLTVLAVSSVVGGIVLLLGWDRIAVIVFNDRVSGGLMWLVFAAICLRMLQTFSSVFFRSTHHTTTGVLLLHLPREVGLAVAFVALLLLWREATIELVISIYVGILGLAVALCAFMVAKFWRTHSGHGKVAETISYASLFMLTMPMFASNVGGEIARTCDLWILGAMGETHIMHVWYYGNTERFRINLPIKAAAWRTFSQKTIWPNEIGAWHVDLLDAEGNRLEVLNFHIEQ